MSNTKATVGVERLTSFSKTAESCLFYLETTMKENKRKKYAAKYHAKYPWKRSYSAAKDRCTNPKSNRYCTYGAKGIKFLMTPDDFKFLWFRDKAYNMENPTIDREDNDGHYELSNCRFMERTENSGKDNRTPVYQFDMRGKHINSFKSILEATKITGVNMALISLCIRDKVRYAGNFKWYKRLTNNNPKEQKVGNMKFKCSKCGKIFKRDGRHNYYKGRIYILSYCEEKGDIARCYTVK